MSLVFAKDILTRKYPPGHSTVQKLLDENACLIQTIVDCQNAGRVQDAAEYQQTLHRNLVYLSNLCDEAQTLIAELQAPLENASGSTPGLQPIVTTTASNGTPNQGVQPGVERQPPVVEQQQRPTTNNVPTTASLAPNPIYYSNTNGPDGQQNVYQTQPNRMGPPQHPTTAPPHQGPSLQQPGYGPPPSQQPQQYWQYQQQQQQAPPQSVPYGIQQQQRPQATVVTSSEVVYNNYNSTTIQRYPQPVVVTSSGATLQQNVNYQQQQPVGYGGQQQTITTRPNPNYPSQQEMQNQQVYTAANYQSLQQAPPQQQYPQTAYSQPQ